MEEKKISTTERYQAIMWWFDQQSDMDKAILRSQARLLMKRCRRGEGQMALGEVGAMELLWSLGRLLNKVDKGGSTTLKDGGRE